jgi:hypothetical protein
MRSRIGRPSPALVVAMLALLVALGGTATGLPGKNRIDKNDLRKRVVGPIHVKKNAVKPFQLAPKAVSHFNLADNTIAARAYAYVDANGNVVEDAPSFGIVSGNVNEQAEGIFCFNGLPFTPVHAQVSTSSEAAQTVAGVGVGFDDGNCPGVEQATVQTDDEVTGNPLSDQFFIILY